MEGSNSPGTGMSWRHELLYCHVDGARRLTMGTISDVSTMALSIRKTKRWERKCFRTMFRQKPVTTTLSCSVAQEARFRWLTRGHEQRGRPGIVSLRRQKPLPLSRQGLARLKRNRRDQPVKVSSTSGLPLRVLLWV